MKSSPKPVTPAPQEAKAPAWPAYTVERKPIAWLKPSPRNARTHSDAQIQQIRGSLKRFGWTIPCLAREDGTLIAGHGRVEAAKLEGITEAPVIVATGWSEAQCRAYALAGNRIPLNAGWDEELLKLEIGELPAAELPALGFSQAEIVDLMGFEGKKHDATPQLEGLSYSIVVRCKDEAQQSELLEQFEKDGLTCEALIS
jgi:ParB/Sulfiredoxin domain